MERLKGSEVSHVDEPEAHHLLILCCSTLLRVIVSRAPIGSQERALVGAELFEAFGRLCFTQLIELRHRGAFSTVAQTFAAFCKRCVVVNETRLRSLPENWYYVWADLVTPDSGLTFTGNAPVHSS